MNNTELFQDVVGRFYTSDQAEVAYKQLSDTGFKTEHLSIEKCKVTLKDSVEQSQAVSGAKGGAISGATFGGLIGLFVSLVINNLPGSPDINPFLAVILGAIAWTIPLTIIGWGAGTNVPKSIPGTSDNPMLYEYQLKVWGTPADLEQAKATLHTPPQTLEDSPTP